MGLFSRQKLFCPVCGGEMFVHVEHRVQPCSNECWNEWEWRYTLSIMGKEYYPKKVEVIKQ